VFPVLGGKKNIIENYLATYLAEMESTPESSNATRIQEARKFRSAQEIMRENVVRDRMAIDFFEQRLGKKNLEHSASAAAPLTSRLPRRRRTAKI